MSKKKKGDEKKPYVQLCYDLLDSAAWTSLSYEAQWVYIQLKKQFKYEKGGNSSLTLPFSKVSWKMSNKTFWKKIKELIDYGFIVKKKSGGLFRNPNIYALSDVWWELSKKIVDKEGKAAIELGLAKKKGHGVIENIPEEKRGWKHSKKQRQVSPDTL